MNLTQQIDNDLLEGIDRYLNWCIGYGMATTRVSNFAQELWNDMHLDYSADDGSANRQPADITPDAEGETWADDAVTVEPIDILHTAWRMKMTMMKLYGRYAAQTVRAFAYFDKLFAARNLATA